MSLFAYTPLANSPAARAGVRYGDKILGIDGCFVDSFDDYAKLTADKRTYTVHILRLNKTLDIEIHLGSYKASQEGILMELGERNG